MAVAEDTLTSEALGARITAELESAGPDDLLLVHVVSHGHAADGDATVYVLGSDGSPHPKTDVAHWLANLQNLPGRPLTLFLLDLCFAGAAARLPWQSNVDPRQVRGWVIAACQSGQVAYDGRFTAAVINVLRSVQDGALDIDPAFEHVPLRAVARAIHQEVNRLATEADAVHQQVTASLIDMSVEPDLPFFRNPTYVNDSRSRLRTHLEPGLLPFLDDLHEGLDTRHFLERAVGVGRLVEHTDGLVGCFSGRERELRRLSPWMNGVGDETLSVVTGSPGVGKSALLGVLVCAGHPQLREPTKPVWDRVAQAPYPIDGLAAVHARSRGLGQIVESIAAQLGMPTEVSAVELISLMSERATPAVVVLDALDEADGAETILNELLLPMTKARRVNGSAVARLLVGLRHYEEFKPLLTLARESGLYVDLDDVPGVVLEDDLHKYVMELLRAVPAYRCHGAVSGAFANAVARVLAAAREDAEGQRWGPFLVAGLYTRHLITMHPKPSQLGPEPAEQLGANAPSTLPEVLELDLKGRRADQPWLRPVMAVLAQARGQGMPITIIARVAADLDTRLPTPTLSDIRSALGEAKFFLRQTTDTDRTTVYRLFHQGLADYLGAHPFGSDRDDIDYPDVLLNALLAPLGPARAWNWAAAEPYLFRHVLDHAGTVGRITDILADPAFLLHPKAAEPLAELDPAQHRVLGLLAELHLNGGPALSRDALALAAARYGLIDLARRTAALPLPTPMSWQPRWTVGPPPRLVPAATPTPPPPVDDAVELRDARHISAVRTVSLSADSRMFVSRGADASVHTWDQSSTPPHDQSLRLPEAAAVGISADGQHLALGTERGKVRLIDLVSGNTLVQPASHTSGVVAVAIKTDGSELVYVDAYGNVRSWVRGTPREGLTVRTEQRFVHWAATFEDLGPLVVCGGSDGTVTLWDAQSGESRRVAQHPSPVVDVAVGGGGRSIVSASEDGSVRVWTRADDLVRSASVGARAVAVDAAGRIVAICDKLGFLFLWDAATDSLIERLDEHPVPVTAVALSANAQLVGFGNEAGTIGIWRPASTSRQQAHPPRDGMAGSSPPLCAVAMGFEEGLPIVMVGDTAGLVNTVHLENGNLTGQTCQGTGSVQTIAGQRVGGTYLTRVSWAGDETRLWEPTSDTVIDAGIWAGLPTADQIDADRRTILLKGQLIEVIGQPDGTVQLHQAAQQNLIGTLPGGHDGPITTVTCGLLAGRPTAFTGGDDGTVRVWDLLDERLADVIEVPAPVFGISYAPGELVVGAGGEVIAFGHQVSLGDS